MIEVEGLTKRYGERTAVDGISFRVEAGEIVGFLGPNGAGKSTSLRMITGYLAPTRGTVRVAGHDVAERPAEARRAVGYMPEGVPLYPELRVVEYLRHRAALKGVPRRLVRARVEASLEAAGVADARDRLIGQLSKGYRQRVGLADALVADPPVLVLDEPTAGLDPNQIRGVRDLVRGFAGKKTVILSTHILPEVEASCGRVLILHRGKLVSDGPPGALRGRASGGRVVHLEGRGEPQAFVDALARVPGVHAVAPVDGAPPGIARVRVEGAEGADEEGLVERLVAAVAAAGLAIRNLRTEQASLEDVFADLTHEGGDATAERAEDAPAERGEEAT